MAAFFGLFKINDYGWTWTSVLGFSRASFGLAFCRRRNYLIEGKVFLNFKRNSMFWDLKSKSLFFPFKELKVAILTLSARHNHTLFLHNLYRPYGLIWIQASLDVIIFFQPLSFYCSIQLSVTPDISALGDSRNFSESSRITIDGWTHDLNNLSCHCSLIRRGKRGE